MGSKQPLPRVIHMTVPVNKEQAFNLSVPCAGQNEVNQAKPMAPPPPPPPKK